MKFIVIKTRLILVRLLFCALPAVLTAVYPALAQEQSSGVIAVPAQIAEELRLAENWAQLEQMAAPWSEADGSNWEAWYYYGLAQLRLGKAEEALVSLDTAHRLSVGRKDTLQLLLGDTYVQIGKWRKAEHTYRQLLLHYPNNAALWDKLRHVIEEYLKQTPENSAETKQSLIEILKKLLTFGGYINQPDLWLRYATLLLESAQPAAARTAYSQFLRLKPNDLATLEWVFNYDVQHADAETLQATMAHLARIDQHNPLLRIYQAQQALTAGNRRDARYHYEAVMGNDAYPYQQAQALAGLGDLAGGARRGEALSYYQRAINAYPGYLYPWERIVVILRAQNRHYLAQRYFSRLRQIEKFIAEEGGEVPRRFLHDIEGG